MSLSATSTHLSNISRDGDSTTSLGTLPQAVWGCYDPSGWGCCSRTWRPPSHHPKNTPWSGEEHQAPFLIIYLQPGGSVVHTLASSQPSGDGPYSGRDGAARPPRTLTQNKGQIFLAAANERAWSMSRRQAAGTAGVRCGWG